MKYHEHINYVALKKINDINSKLDVLYGSLLQVDSELDHILTKDLYIIKDISSLGWYWINVYNINTNVFLKFKFNSNEMERFLEGKYNKVGVFTYTIL